MQVLIVNNSSYQITAMTACSKITFSIRDHDSFFEELLFIYYYYYFVFFVFFVFLVFFVFFVFFVFVVFVFVMCRGYSRAYNPR